MIHLSHNIESSEKIFLRNPTSTVLGQKIIGASVSMIDELGFEQFTFKKLGSEIGSPENSIYRYFENKHRLLVYLVAWYWKWVDNTIDNALSPLQSPTEKLEKIIEILVKPIENADSIPFVDETVLSRVIISESIKAFRIKDVGLQNSKGYYQNYQEVVERVSNVVREVNANYEYPKMLVTSVIEGVHQQRFFAANLPSLTSGREGKDAIGSFYRNFVFQTLA